MKIQRIRQWVVGAGLFVALPFLYTEHRFKIDPLSFVLYPVFRQTTPYHEDNAANYLSHDTLDIIQSGKRIAAAATEDGHFYFNTLRIWNAETLRAERTLTDPTIGFSGFESIINPQGTVLATAGSVQVAQVLNAETGEVLPALASGNLDANSLESTANDVALSPDGLHAVAAQWSDDNQQWQVNFVNVQTGAVERSIVPELEHDLDEIYHVALSPDGKLLAIALSRSVQIWRIDEPSNSTLLHSVASEPKTYTSNAVDVRIEPLIFNADSTRLTIQETVARIKQIDTSTGEVLLEKKDFCFDDALAISPSGTQYACKQRWEENDVIAIGSLENDEPPMLIEGFKLSNYNAFSADGKSLLAENSARDYFLYNIETEEAVRIEDDFIEGGIERAAFNRDRTAILIHTYSRTYRLDDGSVRYVTPLIVLDANTLEPIQTLPLNVYSYSYISQLSNQTIAVQQEKKVLNFWHVDSTELKHHHSFYSEITNFPHAAAFSPNGETFVVIYTPEINSAEGKKIAVVDVSSGQISHTLRLDDVDYKSIAFSADGEKLIITRSVIFSEAEDFQRTHHMEIRDVETGDVIQQFDLFASSESALVETITENNRRPYLADFALSDDGKRLITRTEEAVYLWNGETGEHIRTLAEFDPSKPEKRAAAWDVAVSKDNQWAALAGYDGKLYIWDLETGKPIRAIPTRSLPFEQGDDGVSNLAFSDDRTKLFATSGSQIVQWRLPSRLSLF